MNGCLCFVNFHLNRVELTSPPISAQSLGALSSPTSDKDPFPQIDAFVKTVNADLPASSRGRNSLSELQKSSSQVEQWYIESLEKYAQILDSMPKATLETIFGSNTETFFKLKVLKQKLKAKTKINQKSIERLQTAATPLPAPQPSSSHPHSDDDDDDEFDKMVKRGKFRGIEQSSQPAKAFDASDMFTQQSNELATTSQTSQQSNQGNSGTENDGLSGEFDGNHFDHSALMESSLHNKFGLKSFRPNQLQAINATMLGRDCFM